MKVVIKLKYKNKVYSSEISEVTEEEKRELIDLIEKVAGGKVNYKIMKIEDYFIGKVRFDEHGSGFIFDEENHMIAEVRGWGRIQNLFMKNGKFEKDEDYYDAEKFQDEVGRFIADAINEKIEREKYKDELTGSY